jgi:hypothetical protein
MPVTNLKALPGHGSLTLTWELSTGQWFAVPFLRSPSGAWICGPPCKTECDFQGLEPVAYEVQVVPVGAQSVPNTITATPLAPLPPVVFFGDGPVH